MAAAGLDAIGENEGTETDKTPMHQSKTRQRYEKRLRKAVAKEQRELRTLATKYLRPKHACYVFEEMHMSLGKETPRVLNRSDADAIGFALPSATEVLQGRDGRRRSNKQYMYHSGSVYAHPSMEQVGDEQRPTSVGRVRAIQAPILDSLPTTVVGVCNEQRRVQLDMGAQFSVAGEEWKALGERQEMPPPIDYVEGFTGAVSNVMGVSRFLFHTQYEQNMIVDALIVDGATAEFLLGEDWMLAKGVKIDFTASEMKGYEAKTKKVVLFQYLKSSNTDAMPSKVRLLKRAKVPANP